ncbi:PLDc N-terminal domain-containing protein [Glaciibacter psychrotolerans]|uniref:Cardiolipin synthase N-terminal domain-containing protein n=1 Tax=Glaciibacter psychrotolerans TaxID=670054 RepID=A0A7Z0EFS8_9MICO|nr:PLDc N-terminal domain-containing protein [Leifsonia psychrotolerans]NYJ20730.1 hypothetical protein [Leifsonia psychrotolerans]
MARVWFLLGLMVVVLTVYTLVDAAMLQRERIRGLPRWAWILVILIIPVIGPFLWLSVGRGRRSASAGRGTRSLAPDDDPDFLKGLDVKATQEQRIRQLEQELADLDKPDPHGNGGKPTRPGTAGTSGAAGSATADGSAGVPPKNNDTGDGETPGRRDA